MSDLDHMWGRKCQASHVDDDTDTSYMWEVHCNCTCITPVHICTSQLHYVHACTCACKCPKIRTLSTIHYNEGPRVLLARRTDRRCYFCPVYIYIRIHVHVIHAILNFIAGNSLVLCATCMYMYVLTCTCTLHHQISVHFV